MQARVSQVSILSRTLYNMYINDATQTPGVYLAHFADNTCLHAPKRKDCYVLGKFAAAWPQRWNIKINEDKTQEIYLLIETYIEWAEDSICKQVKVSPRGLR
jgi:hypothetical protein